MTGAAAAYSLAGKPLPHLHYRIKNEIPFARGLGSSSAAIVGGLVAGSVLAGTNFSTHISQLSLLYRVCKHQVFCLLKPAMTK
jgi:homoserine kinase